MANLLERMKEKGKEQIEIWVGGISSPEGMSEDDIKDSAADASIDIFSDMGFSAEDTEDGDTEKLYAFLLDTAEAELRKRRGKS